MKNLESGSAARSFKYQEDWTEDFKSKCDVDFIVEDTVFPVHSMFFYQSKVLQGCLDDPTNPGRMSMKLCFKGTKKQHMDTFLCQLYGNGEPLELLNGGSLLKVINLAIKLDCPRVLKFVKINLEGNLDILRRDMCAGGEAAMLKWLGVLHTLSSTPVTEVVMECSLEIFRDVLDWHGKEKWVSLLKSIPCDLAHQITYSLWNDKAPAMEKEVKSTLSFTSKCSSCNRQIMRRNIVEDVSFEEFRCSKCKGSKHIYTFERI